MNEKEQRMINNQLTKRAGFDFTACGHCTHKDVKCPPHVYENEPAVLCATYQPAEVKEEKTEIRKFSSGATRDTVQGKLDYVKALSPIVLRRLVQYLDKHRLQPDGSYRDFDNWKKGMPQEVYLSSLGRHFLAVWLLAHGNTVEDKHGPVEIEDALAAIIFNASGYLHELLGAKGK